MRHIHEDAQAIALADVEQLTPGAAAAGRDQRAHLDVACRNTAVEGRGNAVERLQLFEPLQVGLVGADAGPHGVDARLHGGHAGIARFEIGLFLIRILVRNHALLDQLFPAAESGLG